MKNQIVAERIKLMIDFFLLTSPLKSGILSINDNDYQLACAYRKMLWAKLYAGQV